MISQQSKIADISWRGAEPSTRCKSLWQPQIVGILGVVGPSWQARAAPLRSLPFQYRRLSSYQSGIRSMIRIVGMEVGALSFGRGSLNLGAL